MEAIRNIECYNVGYTHMLFALNLDASTGLGGGIMNNILENLVISNYSLLGGGLQYFHYGNTEPWVRILAPETD